MKCIGVRWAVVLAVGLCLGACRDSSHSPGGPVMEPTPAPAPESPDGDTANEGEPAGHTDGGTPPDGGAPAGGPPDGGATLPQAGDVQWARVFGTGHKDFAQALAADPQGNAVIAGTYRGWGERLEMGGEPLPDHSVETEADLPDLFVAKFSPSGAHLWSRGFGGSASTVGAGSLVVDGEGGIYVVGSYWGWPELGTGRLPYSGEDACFLMKLSASGETRWVRPFVGGLRCGDWRLATARGRLYLLAHMQAPVDFGGRVLSGGSRARAALVRYASDGTLEEARTLGDENAFAVGQALAVDSQGSVLLALQLDGRLPLGDLLLEPATEASVLVKLGPDGGYRWHKVFSDATRPEGPEGVNPLLDVRVGAGDMVLVSGAFRRPFTFAGRTWAAVEPAAWFEAFVGLLGSDGEERWVHVSRSEGFRAMAAARSLATDEAGRFYVVGELNGAFSFCGHRISSGQDSPGTSTGPWNLFTAVLDAQGRCLWARDYTAYGQALSPARVALAPGRGLFLAGFFYGELAEGPVNARWYDGFLFRLEP